MVKEVRFEPPRRRAQSKIEGKSRQRLKEAGPKPDLAMNEINVKMA
jgi:hypothetical protein